MFTVSLNFVFNSSLELTQEPCVGFDPLGAASHFKKERLRLARDVFIECQ